MAAEATIGRRGARSALVLIWWLFALAAGVTAVVLLIRPLFPDHHLMVPVRPFVDACGDVLMRLGAPVETLALPLVARLNDLLNADLALQPHWRPLFVLVLVFLLVYARQVWRVGDRGFAVALFLLGGGIALIAALAAALVPLRAPWWAQGLMAALPLVLVRIALSLSVAVAIVLPGRGREGRESFRRNVPATPGFIILGFACGALAAVLPGLAAGAGLAGLGAALLFMAVTGLVYSFTDCPTPETRAGLAVLAVFTAAALLYATDWLLR